MTFRELTEHDLEQSAAQTMEAFGLSSADSRPRVTEVRYGLFDGSQLAAQAFASRWGMYVGGTSIPTVGVGNVTVAPEHRGGGTAQRLMRELLSRERDSGAVLSGLFGGAPALYRRLGYGLIDRSVLWRIPMHALTGIRPAAPVSLRPASADDQEQCAKLYAEIASTGTAAMDRTNATPWAPWKRATVATLDGCVVGYLAFHTEREGGAVVITVDELLARTADGYRALLGSLGTWTSVAESVLMQAGNGHPALALLRGNPVPSAIAPFMARILHTAEAVQARAWGVRNGQAVIRVVDDLIDENDGVWRIAVENGRAGLERSSLPVQAEFSAEGLALWYMGVARLAQLRILDLADAEPQTATLLDSMAAQTPPMITEFF